MAENGPPDLSPSEAVQRWLDKRSVSLAEQTLTDYGYRLKQFTDWAEVKKGIESMQELTPWLIDEFDAKRKGDDMAPISLAAHQKTVKQWLEWAEEVGIAPEGVSGPIEVPDVDRSKHVSNIKLDQETGLELLKEFRSAARTARRSATSPSRFCGSSAAGWAAPAGSTFGTWTARRTSWSSDTDRSRTRR